MVDNRATYRRKFAAVTPILRGVLEFPEPRGAFYHWITTPGDDETFARELFAARNITVLPGTYLGRKAHGTNPGKGHARIAWVAPEQDCIRAATAIAEWLSGGG